MSSSYIAFTNGANHWWTRFLHPDINHCYLMTVDRGRIIVYEKGILEVKVYTIDEFDDKLGNDLLIRWDTVEAKQGLFMLNTCVGHIKQLLGINRPFIWTPYQLYRYLGGIYVVHEETEGTNTFSSRTSDNEKTDSRAR